MFCEVLKRVRKYVSFFLIFCVCVDVVAHCERLKPEVAWAQREDSLLITIRLANTVEPKIDVLVDKLIFS